MICDQTCIQAHFKTVQEKQQQKIKNNKLGVVVHTYNPSNQEAEAGGSRVLGQPELHSETLSQKIKLKLNNKEVLSKDSRLNIQV
jgi:hypothetical protein